MEEYGVSVFPHFETGSKVLKSRQLRSPIIDSQAVDATVDDVILASRVQKALRELPADVLEGVKVTATTETPKLCTRF